MTSWKFKDKRIRVMKPIIRLDNKSDVDKFPQELAFSSELLGGWKRTFCPKINKNKGTEEQRCAFIKYRYKHDMKGQQRFSKKFKSIMDAQIYLSTFRLAHETQRQKKKMQETIRNFECNNFRAESRTINWCKYEKYQYCRLKSYQWSSCPCFCHRGFNYKNPKNSLEPSTLLWKMKAEEEARTLCKWKEKQNYQTSLEKKKIER